MERSRHCRVQGKIFPQLVNDHRMHGKIDIVKSRASALIMGGDIAMANHPNRSRRRAVEFTTREAQMLWVALSNGAGDDAIYNLGMTAGERAKFRRAANRLAE